METQPHKRRANFNDLTGKRFGRWLVLGEGEFITGRHSQWRVRCDCGTEKTAYYGSLMSGKSQSCGCRHKEIISISRPLEERHSNDNLTYRAWLSMKGRCYNPNLRCYRRYGGRGIRVCDEWLNDFDAFLKDMGPRPEDRSLGRIDNNGNYEPSNCRWETAKQQASNTSRTHREEWKGDVLCWKEICEVENVFYTDFHRLKSNGASTVDAVLQVRSKGRAFDFVAERTPKATPPKEVKARKRGRPRTLPPKTITTAQAMPIYNAEDARLWGCIDRCKKRGITYRGPLPTDYASKPTTTA